MRIGIVSYADKSKYASEVPDEDFLLYHFLEEKNYQPAILVWNDPDVKWEDYGALIIKSTWDYFDGKIDEFYEWLDQIKKKGIRLFNSADLVKWNADKKYLKDIEAAGLKIVPMELVTKDISFDADRYFNSFKTEKLILKPSVSGGARNTIIIEKGKEYSKEMINEWLSDEDYLIQPFINEVTKTGEWSFVFFGGKFSHHLLKVAKAGDFRVQHVYGGSILTPELPVHLLKQAEKIIHQFASDSLYARVDGVEVNGELWLMELELIEPYLFFFTHQHSLENYYKAFEEKLNQY